MLPETMSSTIRARMANNTDTTLDASIIAEANLVKLRLESGDFLPWFLFKDTRYGAAIGLANNSERADLPCDFLREYEETKYCMFYEDPDNADTWGGVEKMQYAKALAKHTSTGVPKTYDIMGSYIYVRPAADQAHTLRLLYYASEPDIENGKENQWMKYAPDLILAETGFVIASQYVVMPEIAAVFNAMKGEALRRLVVEHTARVEAGYMRTMGDD